MAELRSKLVLIKRYGIEYIVTGLLIGIPSPIGRLLRNIIYRLLFCELGKSVNIQANVRLIGTGRMRIGDRVRIYSGTYISNRGNKISFANDVSIDRGVDIRADHGFNGKIQIGENTYIGPYVCMAGPGKIIIGKDCMIASHASLYANNHIFTDPNLPFREQGLRVTGIVIEDDCWLGTGVRVVDGVTIGRGSIIGAGAVVTRDIPPFSIAVGVPAKVIGQRGENLVREVGKSLR